MPTMNNGSGMVMGIVIGRFVGALVGLVAVDIAKFATTGLLVGMGLGTLFELATRPS